MKKIVVLLLIVCFALPAFADDAKVLPQGVFRFYLAPSYSFASQAYDADGEKVDIPASPNGGKLTVFNIGTALEYGVTDWMSAAFQWAPGYHVYSAFEDAEKQSINGPQELFAGAKIQLIGPKGLAAQSESIRLAFAAGAMIPLGFGYDAEAEAANALSGEDYNVGSSKNVFGIGGRFYADYVVNKSFFLNLYCEFKYFLPKDGKDDFSSQFMNQHPLLGNPTIPDEIKYGYELTLEIEPQFSTPIGTGMELSAGIPVTYTMWPEVEYDGVAAADSDGSILKIAPSATLSLWNAPIPVEFKLGYSLPLMGTNTNVMNTIIFQIKSYVKF